MQLILVVYIGLFSLMTVVMLVAEVFLSSPDDRDPLAETLFDFAAAAILLAGMIFLALDLSQPILKRLWLVAAPIAALYVVISSLRARSKRLRRDSEPAEPGSVHVTDFLTLFFLAPALAFNLWYALAER